MIKKQRLLTPGPTPIPEEVLLEMARPLCHHRTQPFRTLFSDVEAMLKKVFMTESDVYVMSASGSGGMEAAFVNVLSPGDEVIVIDGGKFGHRFCDFAETYDVICHTIVVPWGESFNMAEFEKVLSLRKTVKAVFVTLCETSTGVVFPVKEIASRVAKTDALLIVDAISGLGADELRMDDWGIDVVITGSQKGLMIPPGLAFVAVNDNAWTFVEEARLPRFYFDLRKYKKSLNTMDTPFTPATTLVMALKVALQMIVDEGLENVWQRHHDLAVATRAALEAMGLTLFAEAPSNALTVAHMPAGIDGTVFLNRLRDEMGIVLAGGQGAFRGKIFRIAHLGYQADADLLVGISAVEKMLVDMGHHCSPGVAVASFQTVFTSLQKQTH